MSRRMPKKPTSIYILYDENCQPRYIGKSECVKGRMRAHRINFKWFSFYIVIETVPLDVPWEEREIFWIAYYKQWYKLENKHEGGNCPPPHSPEAAKRIGRINSSKMKGRKVSPQALENMKAAANRPEVREANRRKSLGRKEDPEVTARRAAKLRRKLGPYSEERKAAMRATRERNGTSLKGRKLSAEHIAKCAASNRGKKRSEESKARAKEGRARAMLLRKENQISQLPEQIPLLTEPLQLNAAPNVNLYSQPNVDTPHSGALPTIENELEN